LSRSKASNAATAASGSPRSRPTSRAKWFRVPKGTHERQVAVDRRRCDWRQRAVAAGDPEHVGVGAPDELVEVVALAEAVHFDAALARRGLELVRARAVARPRVDDEEPPHGLGRRSSKVRPIGSLAPAGGVAMIRVMSDGNLHRIEDELGDRWLEEWASEGVSAIEAYLAKHLAFQTFLENDRPA
jgi:hypothetical protein